MRIFVPALLVLYGLQATPSPAAEFKGVRLGEPLLISRERAVFGTLDCNPMSMSPDTYQQYLMRMQSVVPGARKICTASTSIAAVPATVTVVLGPSRSVQRLTFEFDGRRYDDIVSAMSVKWGDGIQEIRAEADESTWWDFEDGSTVSVHRVPSDGSAVGGDAAATGLAEYSVALTSPAGDL